ncbi:MAG: ABC transporter substrate-binding protein [Synergistaceae bacterium]|nr:ABC transporter substrate-binding protein [Synergistaceae bacterium]
MKKSAVILLVFALVVGLCGVSGAAPKDTLLVADMYDATTMDPIGHNDMPSHRACNALYDTLVVLNPETKEMEPSLAEKWEFLSGKDYKFYLRKGVKFHNGEELKAGDVKFSLERATTDAGAKIKNYSQNLDSVEVLDDYTFILHLKEVNFSFFASLTHSWSCIISEKAFGAAGDNYGMNPVGTGPFKFVSWQKGSKYLLERFDDFWGPKAKIKFLEVRSVPEPTSRTIELESGGADVAYPIAVNDMARIEENENLILYREPQTSVVYMGFNMTKKPFNDIRVRQAISAALDVVGVQAAVYRGVGRVPGSLVTSAIPYSIEDEVPPHVQDVEKAKSLLTEAGIKDLSLEIWTNENKERVDMSTIIQAQLEEVGIKAEIKVLEWGAYLQGLNEKQHDLFLLGWVSSLPDPNFSIDGLLESSAGSNFTFTIDKKLDEYLAKGRSIPNGPEREALYRELQLYVNELLPMIYLHKNESIAGSQKNVKGFKASGNDLHSFRGVSLE